MTTRKAERTRRFARTPQAAAPAASPDRATPDTEPAAPPATEKTARPASKIAQVIGLLKRDEGATLDEMVTATGWQPHTTRAALTGLKKKGHTIERTKRVDVTCYRIVAGA